MTSEVRTSNRVPSLIGRSSASNTPVVVYVDPDSHRLLVDVDVTDISALTGVTDGEEINAANQGAMVLGTDGSNYQVLGTDADGHLQVDVLSGGGGGTLVADNDAVNAADTGVLILGTDGSNYQVLAVSADGRLSVDVNSSASHAVTNAGTFAVQAVCTNAGTFATQIDGSALTALQLIDNMISGSEAQVDVITLPAIPTGTNIIGAVKRDVINYTPIRKYYAYTGTVTDGIVWSPAAGKKWVVTDITASISAAATVTLEDDKAGGDATVAAWDWAANGGISSNLQTPWQSDEADADLIITTSAGNIKICVSGYEI